MGVNKKIRILFLPKYGITGPSSRYRFFQFIPLLESEGYIVDVKPLLGNEYVQKLYHSGKKQILGLLIGCLRRVTSLWSWYRYDIIVVEYELLPFFPAWGEYLIKTLGGNFILDFDDAIYLRYKNNPSKICQFLFSKKIEKVIRYSSDVMVGNTTLQKFVSDLSRSSWLMPTVVSVLKYVNYNPALPQGIARIVWIGSPQTSDYLVSLLDVFRDLRDKLSLKIIGADSNIRDLFDGVTVEWVDWHSDTEINEIRSCDIGIMPLSDDDWARGKSGFKIIQYMACKLPVIASPVGANSEIVSDGITGFLASTPSDWKLSLNRLIEDPTLARQLGDEGYKRFVNDYSLESIYPKYLDIIKSNLKS